MKAKTLAWWLVMLGALNWLLVGLGGLTGGAGWNFVALLFGSVPALENLVYVLVGLSGVWFVWDKLGGKK